MYNDGSQTLFILGEQITGQYITPEIDKQLEEITETNLAQRGNSLLMLLHDVYILGHINGVRAERAKRAGRVSNDV